MSFNRIILVGNLGRDPELRYTPQGTPVSTFSLATDERRKDSQGGEQREVTTWFRVTLWGRHAETAAQYLVKGRTVYVEGRLRVEEYTDKEGKLRYSLEVSATDLQFIGGGGERDSGQIPSVRRPFAAVPEGKPSPQPGAWTLKDGKPVRSAPAEPGGVAGSIEDEEIPF